MEKRAIGAITPLRAMMALCFARWLAFNVGLQAGRYALGALAPPLFLLFYAVAAAAALIAAALALAVSGPLPPALAERAAATKAALEHTALPPGAVAGGVARCREPSVPP